MQRFAVRRAELELLIVFNSKLAGLGDIGARISGDISGVDQLTAQKLDFGGRWIGSQSNGGVIDELLLEVQKTTGDNG
jgi:hypothetical protein